MSFSILSTSLCGVQSALCHKHDSFPMTLWSLLGPKPHIAARQIKKSPRCLLDPFSKRFVHRFKNRLHEDEARVVLLCLGLALRLDMLRLECKSECIRRCVRQEPCTWTRLLESASADFVLAQQRILEQHVSPPPKLQPQDSSKARKKKQRRGGGGAQQAELCKCS